MNRILIVLYTVAAGIRPAVAHAEATYMIGVSGDSLPLSSPSVPVSESMLQAFDLLNLNEQLDEFRQNTVDIENQRKFAPIDTLDQLHARDQAIKRAEAARDQVLNTMSDKVRSLARTQDLLFASQQHLAKLGVCLKPAATSSEARDRALTGIRFNLWILASRARSLEGTLERASGARFKVRFYPDEKSLKKAVQSGKVNFAMFSGGGAAWNQLDKAPDLGLLATTAPTQKKANAGHPVKAPKFDFDDPALDKLFGNKELGRLKSITSGLIGRLMPLDSDHKARLKGNSLDEDIKEKKALFEKLKTANAEFKRALEDNPHIAAAPPFGDQELPPDRNREYFSGRLAEECAKLKGNLQTARQQQWAEDCDLRRRLFNLAARSDVKILRLKKEGMEKLVGKMEKEPFLIDGNGARREDLWSLGLWEKKYGTGNPASMAAASVLTRYDKEYKEYDSGRLNAFSMQPDSYRDTLTIVPNDPMPNVPANWIVYNKQDARIGEGLINTLRSRLPLGPKEDPSIDDLTDIFRANAFAAPTADHSRQLASFREVLSTRPNFRELSTAAIRSKESDCGPIGAQSQSAPAPAPAGGHAP